MDNGDDEYYCDECLLTIAETQVTMKSVGGDQSDPSTVGSPQMDITLLRHISHKERY